MRHRAIVVLLTHLLAFGLFDNAEIAVDIAHTQNLLALSNHARYILNGNQLEAGALMFASPSTVVIYPNLVIPEAQYKLTIVNSGTENIDVSVCGVGFGFVSSGVRREWSFSPKFTTANRDTFYQVELISAGPTSVSELKLELRDAIDVAMAGES